MPLRGALRPPDGERTLIDGSMGADDTFFTFFCRKPLRRI